MKQVKIYAEGVDYLPIDDLKDFQGKFKSLSSENSERLKRLIEQRFISPFFIWENSDGEKMLMDGTQRSKVIPEMIDQGYEFIPCDRKGELIDKPKNTFPIVYIYAETEKEAKENLLMISSQHGEIDDVSAMIDGIDEVIKDSVRLVDDEIQLIIEEMEEETVGDNEFKEDVEPITKLGDVWELGSHRLMCGDSTKQEDVLELMDGKDADMLLTDPPYNVDYEGGTGLKIANDNMSDSAFRNFLEDAFLCANHVMRSGAVFYIWHADSEGYNFRGACHDIGWRVRQCLIWKKSSLVMGRQDYHWIHEPCLYGKKKGTGLTYDFETGLLKRNDPDFNWDHQPCLYGWKEGAGHTWSSDRKQTTILEFDKPSKSSEHPTMKPVALFSYCMSNNTKKGDIVLDLFGGSGTTLVVAEKKGRVARVMEFGANYCDVIVHRYINWMNENNKDFTIKRNGEVLSLSDIADLEQE